MPIHANTHLGAKYLGGRNVRFLVWAPNVERIEVGLVDRPGEWVPMKCVDDGYYQAELKDVAASARYFYRLEGERVRPDPASRFQPEGVQGPSQIVHELFDWSDEEWRGLPLDAYVIYELHVGLFTPEGTFESAIGQLDTLKELGITAIELMPIAQFPGERNWGYDGVFPFAAQNSYGGPDGLRRLVDACHARGLAVIIDVVYNHMGPEGNHFNEFGPYFTDKYHTPWGEGINFDGPQSDPVRRYFVENVLYWLADCHIDALRLDAVHEIFDQQATPILEEMSQRVDEASQRLGRRMYLMAESNLNNPRIIRPRVDGGYGIHAQWNDDFHHALYTILTSECRMHYCDYGAMEQFAKAWREAFVFTGEYSHRLKRSYGRSTHGLDAAQFIVCGQNHDQVGNRIQGDRLHVQTDFEGYKLMAATVLLSPFVPLLFFGEEYMETAPFMFFMHHSDPALCDAVCQGRMAEFGNLHNEGEEIPRPDDYATYERCKLNMNLRHEGQHKTVWELYKELLRLRREIPVLRRLSMRAVKTFADTEQRILTVLRDGRDSHALMLINLGSRIGEVELPPLTGTWKCRLDTASRNWEGPGSQAPEELDLQQIRHLLLAPHSVVLYQSGIE